jgi:hypothetical protein
MRQDASVRRGIQTATAATSRRRAAGGQRGPGFGGRLMATTLYMVIEHFKGGDAVPVYRRFRERGRLAPQGLSYVSSWVDANFECCYQLMETDSRPLLDEWMARWSDIVDFEVRPVITSAEAAEIIAPRL